MKLRGFFVEVAKLLSSIVKFTKKVNYATNRLKALPSYQVYIYALQETMQTTDWEEIS